MSLRPWILVLATAACGEVPSNPDAPIDAPEPDASQGFTMTLLTPQPSVPLDGANRIVVQITRTGGFTGPVTITSVSPPAGVTVTPVMIGTSATIGDVVIAGTAPLSVGSTVSLTLEATATGLPSQMAALTNLPVTPKPGTLDTTFNGTGSARISFGGDDNASFDAVEVFGGNILAAGYGISGLGAQRIATMRFTSAGAVDATWNGGALLKTGFSASSGASSYAVAVGHQVDGRQIVIGNHSEGGATNVGAVRYATNGGGGGIDFGNTGIALVNIAGNEVANDGIVQSTNQIVIVGSKDGHHLIVRLAPDGFLDTTFNTTGYERTVLGSASQAGAVVVDSMERLVIAGTFVMSGQGELVLERRLANGTLDPAFGTAGRVFVIGPADESTVAVRTLSDKIYVASNASDGVTGTYRVRRFLANGTLDTSYGTNGVADLPTMGGPLLDMIVLSDGRVVTLSAQGTSAVFGRLTSTGAADNLFGTGGSSFVTVLIGGAGAPGALFNYNERQIIFVGADSGGTPGPGTFGVVGRIWM